MIRCPCYLFWTLSSACSGEEALGFERSHQWSADYRLCLNPTSQRYARGALVTSFRVGWLSEIVGYCNMADYSCTNICDLPTVKRRDWTRHEHYNMFYMWRIHCWVLIREISPNFVWLFPSCSSILRFMFSWVLSLTLWLLRPALAQVNENYE